MSNFINLDKECWKIIDSYFSTIPNYISKNQIDSYNMFLDEQIGKTIRQFNPIQLVYYMNEKNDLDRYEVDIIVGGSRKGNDVVNDGQNIFIGKPIIHETSIVKRDDGGEEIIVQNKQLYPNEARLKNQNYMVSVSSHIYFIYKVFQGDQLIRTEVREILEVLLGKIPCMLQSKGCVLSGIPRSNLKELGECPYDHGGYFIIDGKEKVITAQTRQIENKIYTKYHGPEDVYEYEAEIRSVPEDSLQPARITRVLIKKPYNAPPSKKDQMKLSSSGLLFVFVPNIKEPIPIFVLFRALGMTTDKEIIQCICGDIESSKMSQEFSKYIYDNIVLSNQIRTQTEALRYIDNLIQSFDTTKKKHINSISKDSELSQYMESIRVKESIEFKYIYDILYNWLFPHVGTYNLLEKAQFLGYMTNQLLLTKWGILELTDRDNYMYKRIDISGFLIAQIFRDLYFRVKNDITYSINTFYNENKTHYNVSNIDSLINIENYLQFFKQEIISDGFKYAFKNCWGLKNAKGCKEGVVQDLGRLTYLGMISHLRRVITPLGSSSKLRGPHMLHLSTYGILCPIETPDGGNVGVKTNIALLTDITFGSHSNGIYQALIDNNLITLNQISTGNAVKDLDLVKIFLNGRWVGYHKYPNLLIRRLKLLRRNAYINIYTSIAWYYEQREIKISTDSGRSCHPMLINNSETNSLMITEEHLIKLVSNEINWYDLIAGRKNWNQYDNQYYATQKTDFELLRYGGVIEFIDTEEANTCMVAINLHEIINNQNTRYTHCEIHPSVIFGIMGSIIPHVQTNQLPRNLYSCGQGKQAIGVYASNFRNRMDTKTQVLYYPQKPLVQTRMSKYLYNNILPYGINAIIAIACYTGYNQDDSIIFNRASLQRGLFRTIKFRTYSIREEENEFTGFKSIICNPLLFQRENPGIVLQNLKPGNYTKLDDNGIVRVGLKVVEDDIVVGRVIPTSKTDENNRQIYLDVSEYIRRAETGIIDRIFFSHDNNNFLFVKVRLRKEKIPEMGDKFASRSGQKGIMGMILSEEDMPVSKNGIRPDMIINPQAFPKRMTISQFIECLQNKECSLKGFFGDSSPFQNILLDKIGDVLEEKLGLARNGCEILYNGMTGMPIEHEIFIGPTYYERLQHQVEDKMHSRAEGSMTMLSKQPTGGRSIGGGLRIGEMERDSILAHGISGFLKETMGDRSDLSDAVVCTGCGCFGIVNKDKNIYNCYNCNSTKVYFREGRLNKNQLFNSKNDFKNLQLPYAMKLLTQEIDAMSIGARMITNDTISTWNSIDKDAVTPFLKLKDSMNDQYYESQKAGVKVRNPFNAYQNELKSILILGSHAFTSLDTKHKRPHLIDFSAGRGGDISKWIIADYEYVLALDINESNLFKIRDSLYNRIQDTYTKSYPDWFANSKIDIGISNSCKNLYTTESYDATNHDNKIKLNKIIAQRGKNSFDVASVQFSIHYCFDSITSVDGILQNISDSLREQGVAVITTMDGDSVYELLRTEHNQTKIFSSITDSYTLRLETPHRFGKLPDNENGLGIRMFVKLSNADKEFPEFLVSKEFLINRAKIFGLRLADPTEIARSYRHLISPTTSLIEPHSRMSKEWYSKQLFEEPQFQPMKEFAELYNYFIFIKETPIKYAFNTKSDCVSVSHVNIQTKNIDDVLSTRSLYGQHTRSTQDLMPAKYSPIKELDLQLSTIPEITDMTFVETMIHLVNRTDDMIYIRIKNGNIIQFCPVVSLMGNIDDYEKIMGHGFSDFLEYKLNKYKYFPNLQHETVVTDRRFWKKDGCILKTSKTSLKWDDLYYHEIYHLFNTLCNERNVSDVELIVYKGDQLLDSTHLKYPVLSFYNSDNIVAIPNPFDWWYVSKLFYKTSQGCTNGFLEVAGLDENIINWSTKINKVIFRGSNYGCTDNKRLSVLNYINQNPQLNERVDAKITMFQNDDIFINDNEVNFITPDHNLEDAELSLVELSKYKYILHVDRFVISMKLGYLLTQGSVIIRFIDVPLFKPLWYDKYIHGINPLVNPEAISKADYIVFNNVSELSDVINWCIQNDSICQTIANNGRVKINEILNKDVILDNLNITIHQISNKYEHFKIPEIKIENIESTPKYVSIEVGKVLAEIVKNNISVIKGYFDLDDLSVSKLIVSEGIYKYQTIHLRGDKKLDEAYKFIEDMTEWELFSISQLNDSIVKQVIEKQNEILAVFKVYVLHDGTQIKLFGNVSDISNCYEYISTAMDSGKLPVLVWLPLKTLKLKIQLLDIFDIKQPISIAIVLPIPQNGIEYAIQNIEHLSLILNEDNTIKTHYFIINTSDMDTYNPIGLVNAASRIIPEEYTKLLVVDCKYQLKIPSTSNSKFIAVLHDNAPIIDLNHMFLVSNRTVLQTLQPSYFNVLLSNLPNIIQDIPTNTLLSNMPEISNFDMEDIYQELYSKLKTIPIFTFFTVQEQNEISIIRHLDNVSQTIILFNTNSTSTVINSSDYPVEDKRSIDWSVGYLSKFIDNGRITKNKSTIQINCSSSESQLIERLIRTIEIILLNESPSIKANFIITELNREDGSKDLIISLSKKDKVVEVKQFENIRPYYTLNGELYVRDITQSMVAEFNELIAELKEKNGENREYKTPASTKSLLFMDRIGNIAIFYDISIDNVSLLDLEHDNRNTFQPQSWVDVDLTMMLMDFKFRNNSMLKTVLAVEPKWKSDPMITKHYSVEGRKGVQIKTRDMSSTGLSLEPELSVAADYKYNHID